MHTSRSRALLAFLLAAGSLTGGGFQVVETENQIRITGAHLDAAIHKRGYVSGVAAGSLVDKKTGFHDAGFGLDIVDWLMEPGSDEQYRDQLPRDLVYDFNNLTHGKLPKRSIEGPQICTRAGQLMPDVVRGKDFVAVKTSFRYYLAAPGKATGSEWQQTSYSRRAGVILFPAIASPPRMAAARCFCGSICPATSSTSAATRSAKCT